jgi:putative membrane protein
VSPSDLSVETKRKALSGNAFDRAYIHAMVKDHEDDLGDFNKEIANGSSSVVTDAARQGAKTIQEHLDMIKKIAETNNVAAN